MKLRLLSIALAAAVTGCGGGGGSNNDGGGDMLPQNTPPVFSAVSIEAMNGAAVQVDLSAHASDADGDALSVKAIGALEHGTLTADGLTLSYDPADEFAGTETVSITLTDGTDDVSGTVTLNAYQQISLSGQIVDEPIPGAIVTVTLGGREFQAIADSNGYYTLEISALNLESYVKVSATGGDGSEGKGIELVSLLGEIGTLIESAGEDRTVGGEGDTQANVTNVTTARYVLALDANGGEEIASDETMAEVEKSIDADALLEIAAVIKVILDNPDYSLPEGKESVIDLVMDTEAYNAFVAEVTSGNPDDNALTQAMDQIVKDPALVQGYTSDSLAHVYYGTFPAAQGFLSRGGERYQFNTNGTGSIATEQGVQAFSWALENGSIAVTYDEPLETFGYYAATAELLGEDVANQWAAATQSGQIGATLRYKGMKFTRLVDGDIIDTVSYENIYDLDFDMENTGISAPNQIDATGRGQQLLRDAAASQPMPIVAADLQDTWAVDSYYEYLRSTVDGPQPFTSYAGDLLQFVEGGTGSAVLSERSFTWKLIDNEVQVTFDDGTTLAVQKIDEVGELSAFSLRTFDSQGQLMAFSYNFGTWQDDSATLTPEKVITAEGHHWATFVNGWSANYWKDGEYQYVEGSGFGWEFNQDGTSSNVQYFYDSADYDADGDTAEVLDSRYYGTWSIGNDGVLSVTRCPGDVCRKREWLGLQASEGEIVILEREYFQQYEGLAFPPRINIYRDWANPQVNWNPIPASGRLVAYPTRRIPGND
ncbi:Ig-like domain-containing protein [Microbulbifer bruguierae]|uniref:Ig-like domain-containing protein n=1 Tax=Microbulbifer bruguierae TaxID=3029061 RepID=A0ABY8NBF5_9GAMM|nr:Ig-like domain-containing protein [Microbulbifer bruguierae]WGL15739.1 Ig-like domain-containing protein [Microbulbifer bruguierae]